jgi:hypothetical protein
MAIRVDVYTIGGMASGVLARSGRLLEALAEESLTLAGASWQAIDEGAARLVGSMAFATDDILFAVADDEPGLAVHVAWHHVLLDSGPYRIEGELGTLPGFDPGRSLTRPSGEFLLLRDVRLSVRDRLEAGVLIGDHALVNRYGVERIQADLDLGFFFPGAAIVSGKPSSRVV